MAADRAKALEALAPGTRDYYYYGCLEALGREDFEATRSLLGDWVRRFGRQPEVEQIENRLLLLSHREHESLTYEELRKKLGVSFAHRRRVPGAKRGLPTRLNDDLIRAERLDARALSAYPETVDGFRPSAYRALATRELSAGQLRSLLTRAAEPDLPGLPQLVIRDLEGRGAGDFGDLAIHGQLTLEQLDACLRLKPGLLTSQDFVATYLLRLHPGSDEDLRVDASVRAAYLERLDAFTQRLPQQHNS
ncbi:MAG TPA: hypothetical protein PKE00_17145, partial [Planctomycetota bacterium]|nr:hypothetical protein [Planctomycetota bacterium]